MSDELGRRELGRVLLAGGAGLVLGTALEARAQRRAPRTPNPWLYVTIGTDDTVTVASTGLEMGQGVWTGLATLVAEELDADWAQMRGRSAPVTPRYGRQYTGGSSSTRRNHRRLRQVGATARAMLVAAAAERWSVPRAQITVERGVVSHASSSRTARFGELVEAARERSVPRGVALKDAADFRLIGQRLPRLDVPAKSDGSATYTMDLYPERVLTTLVARSPRFGGRVADFDARAALAIDGVVAVERVPSGVAVYGEGFWAAKRGRDALQIRWDDSDAETRSTHELIAAHTERLDHRGEVWERRGNYAGQLTPREGDRAFSADFVFPYLAHAPMEPLDCVLQWTDGGAEARFGAQMPSNDRDAIARVLGLRPERVQLHVELAGGSFGRRGAPDSHVAVEAAEILKRSPGRRPIKLIWTREDDIRGGYFRPLVVHRLEATVTARGAIRAWRHRIAAQPVRPRREGIDGMSVEGANIPYAIPHFGVEYHLRRVGVPCLWWRAVGSTHNAYSTECLLDEILEATGADAVRGRLALLSRRPRHAGVLRAAAQLARWGREPAPGHAFGVAIARSFGTYVAQIADVSMRSDGLPQVHEVFCAVDCGLALNPDVVAAQMEGGIGFGLGAALHDEITLDAGRVVQSNFHDFRSLRIGEMPDVHVAIVPSSEDPTGVGEPGLPPIAPAVANAVRRLTGQPTRRLPFRRAR